MYNDIMLLKYSSISSHICSFFGMSRVAKASKSQVKCFHIWQSDDVFEKSDDISIVNGFVVPDSETEALMS